LTHTGEGFHADDVVVDSGGSGSGNSYLSSWRLRDITYANPLVNNNSSYPQISQMAWIENSNNSNDSN
jgi:hypothetical protein